LYKNTIESIRVFAKLQQKACSRYKTTERIIMDTNNGSNGRNYVVREFVIKTLENSDVDA